MPTLFECVGRISPGVFCGYGDCVFQWQAATPPTPDNSFGHIKERTSLARMFFARWDYDCRKIHISLTGHSPAMIERLSTLHHEELRRLTTQLPLLIKRIAKLSADEVSL